MNTKLNHFESVVSNLRTTLAVKTGSQTPKNIELPSAKVIQLPLWDEAVRCLPNEIVRSALFNARNRSLARAQCKNAEIAVVGDGRISYTGEELRQDDETVWLQLIHLAKSQPLGDTVRFTPYSFCNSIGWPLKGDSYIRLKNCLTRMQATSLTVYSERLKDGVSLSMIPIFKWNDYAGQSLNRHEVQIAPLLVELFGNVQYTQVEWEQRLALPTGIATWLHGYYASHKIPFAIKITTIKKGAGLTTKSNRKLRQLIEKALDELKAVGFLNDFCIVDDLVRVQRA